jgi:hypothetical protein
MSALPSQSVSNHNPVHPYGKGDMELWSSISKVPERDRSRVGWVVVVMMDGDDGWVEL